MSDETKMTREQLLGKLATLPSANNAEVITMTSKTVNTDVDYLSVMDELKRQIRAVNDGDMRRPEAMLLAQAHALESLFSSLMQVGLNDLGKNSRDSERVIRLALKAQQQCQNSLRNLSDIKHPKAITIAGNANVAQNQQINHHNENDQTELLEVQHGERLDGGTQTETARGNPKVEAVVKINRANNS